MDEIISLLTGILTEMQEINQKLDELRGSGIISIDNINEQLESINGSLTDLTGYGVYSISDICDNLSNIESAIGN